MPEDFGFGWIVNMRRQMLGLSARELAKRIGVDPAYIWKIEKGQTTSPSFQVVMRLSKELAISMESLVKAFELEDWAGFVDVSINRKLHGEDRTAVLDITDDVIEIISKPQFDLEKFTGIIQKVYTLHETKNRKSELYCVITIEKKDWIRVLETPVLTEELLDHYHSAFGTTNDNSFVLQGEIVLTPDKQDTTIERYTLDDLMDLCNSPQDDDFIQHSDGLKKYLEQILGKSDSQEP